MIINKILPFLYKNLISIGFIVIILMMAMTSYYASTQMRQSTKLLAQSNLEQDTNNKLLDNMVHSSLSRTLLLIEMIHSDDPFERDELFQKINSHATNYSLNKTKFKSENHDPILDQLLNEQLVLARKNYPLQNKIYELMMDDNIEEATATLQETLPRQTAILYIQNKMAQQLLRRSKDELRYLQAQNEEVLSLIKEIDWLSILISLLLALFVLIKKNKSDKKLKLQASTDILTKLPNRSELINSINAYIKKEPNSTFAVIFLDIDDFKNINDNYGHETGDRILQSFSNTINSIIEPSDVLSRFGGDEFVLLVHSIKSQLEAVKFVTKLSKVLDTSFLIDGNDIYVSTSIGISLYSHDANDAKLLLKNADIAMYTAKKSGKNCFSFYSKNASEIIEKNHDINHRLRIILNDGNKNGQLYLMYQPLLNIEDGKILECEALIRWKTPEGEQIPPDEFIPLAEKSNLIVKVNQLVIDESCQQQLIWRENGAKKIRININLSGNKLVFSKALKQLIDNIERLNLDYSLFGIELTERTIFDISEESINELKAIRAKGMKISIDDFGTGYSSLSYLRKLPITTLKIDKEFICNLSTDYESQTLVKMMISLGQSLHLEVVAEGVETYEQFKFLEDNFCHMAQGYYLHKPLHNAEISNLKYVA